MPKILHNQKGLAHLLVLIILLAGIGVGVYLSQHPQIFKPKAAESTTQTLTNPNIYILEDDGSLAKGSTWGLTKKFYQTYPGKDVYDFIAFFYKDGNSGVATFFQPAQLKDKGTWGFPPPDGQYKEWGSSGKLLGIIDITFPFKTTFLEPSQNNGVVSLIDRYYFGLLLHELTHYWGVNLPDQLKEALVWNGPEEGYKQGHFEFSTGSWVSVDLNTKEKYIEESDGKYYFTRNCSQEPKHHDFDLYSMGLKSASEVEDKLVVRNLASMISARFSPIIECDTRKEVDKTLIKKVYTIQDFINVLGSRIPSSENAQKDFSLAFVMIVPKGSSLTLQEKTAFNWIANKFPIVWNKSTSGRSTINDTKPSDLTPPKITNAVVSSTISSITVKWQTDKPSSSFVIYRPQVEYYYDFIYPGIITNPPNLSTNHELVIQQSTGYPIIPGISHSVKIISIDENYNMASHDLGKIIPGNSLPSSPTPTPSISPLPSSTGCNPGKFNKKTWISLGVLCDPSKPGYEGQKWKCQESVVFKKYKKNEKVCGVVTQPLSSYDLIQSNSDE